LVDALASGASGFTAVKVRVLSWAPSSFPSKSDEFKYSPVKQGIFAYLRPVASQGICWQPADLGVFLGV
jgi:hypothetical protein